jgi:putative phosphoribosyl transferase
MDSANQIATMAFTLSRTSLTIPSGDGLIHADLHLPRSSSGLVLFCHGAGSNRFSPRNLHVAEHLVHGGIATLLLDLQQSDTPSNQHTLTTLERQRDRLLNAIDWSTDQPSLQTLPLGLFGSSSGAAVAVMGAAQRPERVRSVVCRGGRPDLAFQRLADVRCPVLLLVGEHDVDVLELNAWAAGQLQVRNELVVIPAAGHLFAEPGSLDAVAEQAYSWFIDQFQQYQ